MRLHGLGRMAQGRERHQALAAEPAVGRLPDLRRRPAIARRAQLHDVGHARFLVVQTDLDAGDATRALADGEDGGEPGVQLVGVLVETVLQRLALGDEVLHRAQRHEVEARLPCRRPARGSRCRGRGTRSAAAAGAMPSSSSRARLKLISGVHGRRSSRCPSRPGRPLNQAHAAMNVNSSSGGPAKSCWRAIQSA